MDQPKNVDPKTKQSKVSDLVDNVNIMPNFKMYITCCAIFDL